MPRTKDVGMDEIVDRCARGVASLEEGQQLRDYVHELRREAAYAARDARGAAEVLVGIPAYMAQWSMFDRIARTLERVLERPE